MDLLEIYVFVFILLLCIPPFIGAMIGYFIREIKKEILEFEIREANK